MTKINIRQINNTDFDSIIKLHNSHHCDFRTVNDFKWEYITYSNKKYVFYVIEKNDQIIGMQGMIPIKVNINGTMYLTGKTENSLVEEIPSVRGVLFLRLYYHAMNMCKEVGMKFVWGITGKSDIWEKGLKFKVFQRVLYDTIFIFNVRRVISEIMNKKWILPKKFGMILICYIIRLWSTFRKIITSISINLSYDEYELRMELYSPNDILNLYTGLRTKYPNLIHLEQNINYLKWRVYNNPIIDYVTFFIYGKDKKELKAYCFLAKSKSNIYYLSDFTFQETSAGHILINYILDYCNKEKIGSVLYYGNKSNELINNTFSLLKKYGFIMKRNNSPFVVKDIEFENKSILYDSKNWYINGMWTEGYLI